MILKGPLPSKISNHTEKTKMVKSFALLEASERDQIRGVLLLIFSARTRKKGQALITMMTLVVAVVDKHESSFV